MAKSPVVPVLLRLIDERPAAVFPASGAEPRVPVSPEWKRQLSALRAAGPDRGGWTWWGAPHAARAVARQRCPEIAARRPPGRRGPIQVPLALRRRHTVRRAPLAWHRYRR